MAESVTEIPVNIEESLKEAVQNVTDKPPSSIEGVAIAYLSLVIMAILPIFFGSLRSVKYLKEQKVSKSIHFIRNTISYVVVLDTWLQPERRTYCHRGTFSSQL